MRQLSLLTVLLTMFLVSLACGSGTPLPATPEPATVSTESPTPGNSPIPPKSPATESSIPTAQAASFPGLMVAYLREGNLWFWSEAIPPQLSGTNGPYQMTDSGGLTDVCISSDGKMLAFIRGMEVWTAHTDGTDARLLVTRTVSGGRLKFSPSGLLLAISDKDQIQLIDLTSSAINTVLTYPSIATGYEPEVIWTPDSLGFKTVIPAPTETGQAEFFFVFTTGTAASLAKFAIVPTSESAPFLSPDGGYVIYVATVADGKKSLYLMDSSGATRPYGEPAKSVRAYGWQPGSKHFAYVSETPQGETGTFIGTPDGQPGEISLDVYTNLRWVNEETFLALKENNLFLGSTLGEVNLIDSGVIEFDFSQ